MNLFKTLMSYLRCSDIRNSRFIHALLGEDTSQGRCACRGKWNKYLETEHGDKYCARSSFKKVDVFEV